MQTKLSLKLIFAVLIATLVSACSPDTPEEEMPAVNDENCKPESIRNIMDKGTREKFASLCLRRGSDYSNPGKKREW